MAVSFIGRENRSTPRENHWPVVSHGQALLHNVISSTPHLSGIRTHNVSGHKHSLHMAIQLPYIHDAPPQVNREYYIIKYIYIKYQNPENCTVNKKIKLQTNKPIHKN